MTEDEADALNRRNNALARENADLRARVRVLEERIVRSACSGRPAEPLLTHGYPTPHAPPADDLPLARSIDDIDALYEAIKERALADQDPRLRALMRSAAETE